MANNEYREPHQTAREIGLAKRHETRQERAIRREVVRKAAEVLAERWTQPLDLMNRREDWTYPERSMDERIKSEVDASYRVGPPEDPSLVLKAPTCLEIAELLADSGLLATGRSLEAPIGVQERPCGVTDAHQPHGVGGTANDWWCPGVARSIGSKGGEQ